MDITKLSKHEKATLTKALLRAVTHQARMYDALTDVENITGPLQGLDAKIRDYAIAFDGDHSRKRVARASDFGIGPKAREEFLTWVFDGCTEDK